jgi:hypothetical protein
MPVSVDDAPPGARILETTMSLRPTLRIAGLLFLTAGLARGAEERAVAALPSGLVFEQNGGAFAPEVSFVARGQGVTVFACTDGVALHLAGDDARPAASIRTSFVGGAPATQLVGDTPLPTRIHHLRGSDPAAWSVDNATFGRVRYTEIWPGIDLLLYDAAGELEYDFVVAPGADPSVIGLSHQGVDGISLADSGELVLATAAGELRQSAPVVYQQDGHARRPVEGRFALRPDGTVGFALGSYDATRPLVIDPVLSYATYVGGSNMDHITDIAIDADGRAIVCGYTRSTDLPTTVGAVQPATLNGADRDAFVARISADGTVIDWLTYLGGGVPVWPSNFAWTEAHAVGVDASGGVVVGGETRCEDFPVLNAFDGICNGSDAFLTRLTPDGSALVYSTLMGGAPTVGTGAERVYSLLCAEDGTTWAAGQTHSATGGIPVTAGALDTIHENGGSTGFVTKISPAGAVVWCTYVGGELGLGQPPGTFGPWPRTIVWDLDVDGAGRVYLAAFTNTSDAPVAGAFDAVGCSAADLGEFWAGRLSADGSTLDYGTFLGASLNESESNDLGVACADDGRLWLVGNTSWSDYPVTPGAYDTVFDGAPSSPDGVVTCLDTNASGAASMVWSTFLGGGGPDILHDVEVDEAGNAFVVGVTGGSGFPMIDAWQAFNAGYQDTVLVVLDALGQPVESTFFGGSGAEVASEVSVELGPSGDVYVGFTAGGPGLATPGAAQQIAGSSTDGMVVRWRLGPPTCQPDLGQGGAGNATLSLCGGDLTSGVFSRLRLDGEVGNQAGWLLVGLVDAPTWFAKVQGFLVPTPALFALPVVTDAFGDHEFLVSGGGGPITLYVQAVVAHPGVPSGWAVSNAVEAGFGP